MDYSSRRTGKTAVKEMYNLEQLATNSHQECGIVAPRMQQSQNNLNYHTDAIKRSAMLKAFINYENGRPQLLMTQISQAADLGVSPYTAQGVAAVGGTQAVLESGAAQRVQESAVRFVLEFTAADGLSLSVRLWRLDQGAKEVLSRAIGQAVVQGWDAARAAAQFMYRGEAVPTDVAARAAGGKAAALLRTADLLTGDGGEVWKADRVFRTEINRAHGEAFMAGGEGTPGFAGWRYLLSPLHPRPDTIGSYRAVCVLSDLLNGNSVENLNQNDRVGLAVLLEGTRYRLELAVEGLLTMGRQLGIPDTNSLADA